MLSRYHVCDARALQVSTIISFSLVAGREIKPSNVSGVNRKSDEPNRIPRLFFFFFCANDSINFNPGPIRSNNGIRY